MLNILVTFASVGSVQYLNGGPKKKNQEAQQMVCVSGRMVQKISILSWISVPEGRCVWLQTKKKADSE